MSGLEAAQELIQGVQDLLLGQAFADLVLVLAAVLQQGGEALRPRHAQEPGLAEEQAHGGRDRAPAVGSMSATRKSSQPELSPRGAETRRRAVPLKSSPAATPV